MEKDTFKKRIIIILVFIIIILSLYILLDYKNENKHLNPISDEDVKSKITEIFGDEVAEIEDRTLVLTDNEQYMILVVEDRYLLIDKSSTPPTVHHFTSIKENIPVEVKEIYENGFLALHDDHTHIVYEKLPKDTKVGDTIYIKDPHTYLDEYLATKETTVTKVDDEISEKEKEVLGERIDNVSETENNSAINDNNPDHKNNLYTASEIKEMMNNSDYSGKKIAFLTFDDGPNNVITPKVLDALKENDVKATFFMPGANITDSTKDVLNRMYKEGNSLATHSFNHNYDILYPGRVPNADEIVKQHKQSVDTMKKYLGEDFNTNLFRYPGGHMSWNKDGLKLSDKALEDIGVDYIDWNTMTGDAQPKKFTKPEDVPRPKTVEEVLANFDMSRRYANNPDVAVVLMHDAQDKELTAEALPALIEHLKSQGYEFGTIKY